MLKKQLFIGANWKMNPPPKGSMSEGSPYFSDGDPQIVVFPMFIDIQNCIRCGQLINGAQCGRAEPEGAFTGDVSMKILKEFGCSYVLCGHSEHRRYHHETDEEVSQQLSAAIEAGLIPILCIGETADERMRGETHEKLKTQLGIVLKAHSSKLPFGPQWLTSNQNEKTQSFLIAYEPVWAIGTGKTPTPEEVNEIHAFIRSLLKEKSTRIIYGGSVTGDNAAGFFAQKNIDGALVGGASLKPEEFKKIVEAAKE